MNVWGRVALVAGMVLVAGGLGFTACTAPVKNDTELSGFGLTLRTKTEANGAATNEITGTLPAGMCLKITYRGADGGVTGTDTPTVPGSSQIPPGSVSQSFEIVDCDTPPHTPPRLVLGGTPGTSRALVTDIFGGPIVLDTVDGGPLKNAVYRFRVKNAGDSAWDEVLPILTGGPGTPVPPKVNVISFSQTIPETLGARLIAADTASFTEFRLDWNGTYGYADLASGTNVIQYDAPNGWNVVETFISAMDIFPFGQENVGTTTRKTAGEQASAAVTA